MKIIKGVTFLLTSKEHVDAVLDYLPNAYIGRLFFVKFHLDGRVEVRTQPEDNRRSK